MLKLKVFFTFLFPLLFLTGQLRAEESQAVQRVVILGGGIGGLTSALYAARAGMTPLVVRGPLPGGAIAQSHSVQNWPGELEIPGYDLVERVNKQAELSGANFLDEEVASVDFSSRPFKIFTKDPLNPGKLREIKAQTCVIALGSSPKFLGVPGELGENGYWLKGVYNCALCDGPLYKNKTVAIVGGGDGAITEAHYLSNLAKKVYVIVRKNGFRTVEEGRKQEVLSRPNIEVIYNTTVEEIKGNGEKVTHLVLKNGSKTNTLETDALFLAIGSTPNTQLFQGQVELDKLGYVVVKGDVQTSMPGVFAIGDLIDPIYRQAISAAADGMKAAFQAEKYAASSENLEKMRYALKEKEVTLAKAAANQPGAVEITTVDQFNKELKEGRTPVLVDFYATWCGPCKMISPHFYNVSKKLSGKVKFLKVDVDRFNSLAEKYSVSSMPTLLIFNQKGEFIGRKIGASDILKLLGDIEKTGRNSSVAQINDYLQQKY